jgi:hypothetical protein
MKARIILLVLLMSCLGLQELSHAYNITTHRQITTKAVILSQLEVYLINNLDLSFSNSFLNVDSNLSKNAVSWITDGSEFEDSIKGPPLLRFKNHFHNPLTNQGLSDDLDFFAKSAKSWAISDSGNDWSWQRARQYFYDALTKESSTERDVPLVRSSGASHPGHGGPGPCAQ